MLSTMIATLKSLLKRIPGSYRLRRFSKTAMAAISMAKSLGLPTDDTDLYYLCQRYVARCRGENDSNMYTNGELQVMRQILVGCHVVFDVGANVGEWAELALSIHPGINLHCFEPSEATYRRLLAKAFPSNVVLNNCGLGSTREEEKTLYVYEDGSGLNSVYQRQGLEDGWGLAPQQRTETIQLDTVDNYCHEHAIEYIDFLKVDIEGHELEAFRGASSMLAEGQIKTIQFEYGGCNIDSRVLLKDLFDFFSHYLYAFHKIHPQALQPVERYDQRLENYQYQNWLLVKAD